MTITPLAGDSGGLVFETTHDFQLDGAFSVPSGEQVDGRLWILIAQENGDGSEFQISVDGEILTTISTSEWHVDEEFGFAANGSVTEISTGSITAQIPTIIRAYNL